MAMMRQPAAGPQDQNGTKERQRIVPGRIEGKTAVYSRLSAAFVRAALVIVLIMTPSVFLNEAGADGIQIVTLVAIFAAIFTVIEYTSASPSLVEFRDAPPFNRVRFIAIFGCVFLLSILCSNTENPSTVMRFAHVMGESIGGSIDFPYSPVRLMLVVLPHGTDPEIVSSMRTSAGLAYFISLSSLAIFIILLRRNQWPRKTSQFNVWINLPTFDPTTGGDVVDRLSRDSQINLILGFLLPFIIPAALKVSLYFFEPVNFADPQTMIWTVTAWAFLPASLLMRGVALSRVSQMIFVQRKKAYAKAMAEGMQPA